MQVHLKKDKGDVDAENMGRIIAHWGKLGWNDLEFKVGREK